MADISNPLVQSLPPETDYLTYLTILEYNLDKEQLSTLHELLQDTTLTTNIGWDLVRLLLPLLPESDLCLQDVAFLGNPRETILKVAELLEEIGSKTSDDINDDRKAEDVESVSSGTESSTSITHTSALKFQSLLHMLCILHPRIKTKYPSRFLVTSLRAVLKAFSATAQVSSAIGSVLMLLKTLSGSKRPHLPPRKSQQAIPIVSTRITAPDPEGQPDKPAPGEEESKRRILQSFMTHVVDIYVSSLHSVEDDSAFAWASRYYEKSRPARVVPIRQTFRQRFRDQEELERRDATMSQLLAVGENDILMPWDEISTWLLTRRDQDHGTEFLFDIADLPFSRLGALFSIAARAATALLNNRNVPLPLSIFPQHDMLVNAFVGDDTVCGQSSLIDSLLILGWSGLDSNDLGDWETRSEFQQYLQRLSFLSANTPFSSLRFQIFAYVSTTLYSNPSSEARLDFIQDTMECCPYENLRVASISWLKDQILDAFGMAATNPSMGPSLGIKIPEADSRNVFSHPSTLKSCAPWLFAMPDIEDDDAIVVGLPFWLAVLNFLYLLLSSPTLCKSLNVRDTTNEFNIESQFLNVLDGLLARSKNTDGFDRRYNVFQSEMWTIEDGLTRVRQVQSRELQQ